MPVVIMLSYRNDARQRKTGNAGPRSAGHAVENKLKRGILEKKKID